ncbi:MAG: ABC transporter substrate-binding protein [Arthrospira sp. PLM2.Bin9]|nr:ABC transporter substrate-binding protein [Arthrospira sp. PLM2.Bin9]TVU52418.1 MAG: ABC transporter substrate-binding protein [Arthrospira sp. PLM2.Bin9]
MAKSPYNHRRPSSLLRWWGKIIIMLGLCILVGGCQFQAPQTEGVINLTLWHGINPPPNRDVFQKLVDRFNQDHPHIQVEALYIGQPDQQMPKILTAVVGNAPPDILWYTPIITGQLVELDAIKPIQDWLNNSPVKAEIDPALWTGMELENQIWSVPMATNNTAIFYRPSLFEAAGIETIPSTWSEFRETATKLTTAGEKYGIVLPLGKGEWTVFTWLPFMYSAGGELVRNGEANLVNPGAIAALEFWSNLIEDGSAILSAPERGYEQDNFISGRVAMQITGPWTLGYLDQIGIDYGVFPIPVENQQAAVVGGENLFVMKTTPDREKAALEFLEYVVGSEFQTEWSLGTGYLPINLTTRLDPRYQEYVAKQPALNVFLQQMNWAVSRPNIPGYSRLSENLGRAIEATLLGEPPQSALKASQNRLRLAL